MMGECGILGTVAVQSGPDRAPSLSATQAVD